MKKFDNKFNLPELNTPVINDILTEGSAVIDIETTGLSAKNSFVYLIGFAYKEGEELKTVQLFAEEKAEEFLLLMEFYEILSGFKKILTYNGKKFDIPFLIARSKGYDIDTYFTDILENMPHTDIYRAIKPYKKVLHLASIKQTSIERFLGIKREDEYSGKELIDHYINYINGINADKAHLDFILLHNRDDIVCAARIIPILSYMHIFVSPVTLTNVECKDYTDLYGNSSREFYISFKTKYSVPKNHVFGSHPYFVSLNGNTGKIRVPLFEGELKLFFEDYKNYYYLPEEDTAVHKSIAAFSDKENRVKAKPETAYVKARGEFLPQADKLFTPVLKEGFKSKDLYFELKKGFTDDTEKMQTYLNHILSHLKYR